MDSTDRVTELEAAVAEMRDENAALRDLVRRVALSKQGNDRYPYWNWLCEQLVDEEQRSILETFLAILDDLLDDRGSGARGLRMMPTEARAVIEQVQTHGTIERAAFGSALEEIVGELDPGEVDRLIAALRGQEMVPRLLAALE